MSTYLAVLKRGYVPVSASDDEVYPGNLAALEKGLEARKAERSQDLTRAGELWAEAKELLVEESENETGPGAQGSVEVEDTFCIEGMSRGWGGHGYWPWPGYGG